MLFTKVVTKHTGQFAFQCEINLCGSLLCFLFTKLAKTFNNMCYFSADQVVMVLPMATCFQAPPEYTAKQGDPAAPLET